MKNTMLLILLILLWSSGSSKKQEVQKPRVKISISFPEDKVPEGFFAASGFYNSTETIGTYYLNGKTKTTEKFNRTVEISGPTTLTFLDFISGLFSLKLRGDHSEIKIDFIITFQESPGELKIDVRSNFSFNITITCSMEDVEINGTFICENNTCRQEGGERSNVTKSGDSLRLHLLNSTIVCSHSNQISKTQSQTTIQPNPTSEGSTEQDDSLPKGYVGLYVVLGLLGLLGLLGVGWCVWCVWCVWRARRIPKKKFNNRCDRSNSETFPDVPLQTFHPILEDGLLKPGQRDWV